MSIRRMFAAGMVILCLMAGGSTASAQETLTFSWSQNVGPLNPHGYGANQMFAQSMVYDGLVSYRADGTVAPALAESWEVSEDGRTYTFRLRSDVTFSDGEVFDAAAVKQNFDTILANAAQHDWLDLIHQIETVEVVDPLTLRLTLKSPYYPLLQELALARPVRFLAPGQFPDSGDTADGIKAPVGTGPWKLVETVLGEYDLFERNESYWGPAPAYDHVLVKVISDPNSRAIAFETGEIDLIYGVEGQISPDTFNRFRVAGIYETDLSAPMMTRAVAINSNRAPTSDLGVRRAINHAVDKDLLIAAVLHGTQLRANALFAPNVPYADIGLAPYAFDPTKAEQILQEAGWTHAEGDEYRAKDGQRLTIDFAFIGTDALMKAMAEIIQADLRKVGIEVVLLPEEESSFANRQTSGNFGMVFNDTWGAPYDPHSFVSAMRVPSHADYQAQLGLQEKAQIDADITEVLTTTDEGTRQDLYRSILTTLHEEAVYLPLTYQTASLVAQNGIGGMGFGATSTHIPFEAFIPPAE